MTTTEEQPASPSTASPKAQDRLLLAEDLHKHYKMGHADLHILRGVSLSVKQAEWVAILGQSGSGKSTLLHILGGLDRPSQGKVTFRDMPVFPGKAPMLDKYRSRDVGFVFQFYHLLPEMNALENVVVGAMVGHNMFKWMGRRSKVRQRARELLEQLGIGERANHRPNMLSGGERQRVAIARALINEPALLLADEPTGNLDADTGKQILQVFRDLHAAGQSIVMVTHDLNVADAADRQLSLVKGQLES